MSTPEKSGVLACGETPPQLFAKAAEAMFSFMVGLGDMGRYSFLAVGSEMSMDCSFGSTCHGTAEPKPSRRQRLMKGIFVKAHGDWGSPAEEASVAYKDVEVCHNAGLCKKVARMKPVGVIKG